MRTSLPGDDLDFRTLHLLEILHRTASLSAAAAELDLSTGTASKMLAKARTALDDDLFVRTGTGMTPTTAMTALLPRIDAVLSAAEALTHREAPFNPAECRALVRIAATDNGSAVFLGAALAQFQERAPQLCFVVTGLNADVLESLRTGALDLAVAGDDQLRPSPAFHEAVLTQSTHVVIVRSGHPLALLARERPLVPKDFTQFKRILLTMNKPSGGGVKPIFSWNEADEAQCAVEIPYALSAVMLVSTSDCFVSVPKELGEALVTRLPGGFVMLDDPDQRGRRWEPKLIWHERTQRNALLEWVRSVLIASARTPAGAAGAAGH